jgi:asparagine synthase (glutamine-hydrolysing)
VLGEASPSPELPATHEPPRRALEAAVRIGLERPPCLVSFSGGRDSSVVLAVAAHVARRDGLPLPVPATVRAPGVPASLETEWQERVVRHLALPDWHVEEVGDELDYVGPVAQRGLARHGLLFPAQAHFHVPLLARARGGSLLTGAGGDNVLEVGPRAKARYALRRLREGHQRTAVTPLLGVTPAAVRRAYMRRRPLRVPWLRPAAQRELDRRALDELPPVPAAAALRWTARRRWLEALRRSLGLLAADAGAAIHHPLLDPGFVAAVAGDAGWAGHGGRSRFLPRLVGDLVPRDVLLRRDKTSFRDVYWTRHADEVVARWDGGGLDDDVVGAEKLREVWTAGRPNPATALLLQSVWLAGRGR